MELAQHLSQQAGLIGFRWRRVYPVWLIAPFEQHKTAGGIAIVAGQRQPFCHRPLIKLPLGGTVDAKAHRVGVALTQKVTAPRGEAQSIVAVGQA